MDEWDEFLSRSDAAPEKVSEPAEDVEMETCEVAEMPARDIGEYGDNAEVLMQMALGESFNNLSNNGVWIKSDKNTHNTSSSNSKNVFTGKKRALKTQPACSVPIANTFQDLTRSITSHPLLSHPLSLLKPAYPTMTAREVDSIGLFFYGKCDDVRVAWDGRDDMMKGIEMKRQLIDKPIIIEDVTRENDIRNNIITTDGPEIRVSLENLNLLASSIPPNGKIPWLIPFTVLGGRCDLTSKAVSKLDDINLFFDYCKKSVLKQFRGFETSEHFIIAEGLKVTVESYTPAFEIAVQFRGETHIDPLAPLTNSLFHRQSNYSVEIDFETFRFRGIKSFAPKFDTQNRLFLLLKALNSKITKLPDGEYFLAHQSGTPFIKILENINEHVDGSIKLDSLFK